MSGFAMQPAEVKDFALYLGAEARVTLLAIERFITTEGLHRGGFTGLLAPIGEECEKVARELIEPAFRQMRMKLCNLGDGVLAAAKHTANIDNDHRTVFERTEPWMQGDYKRYLDPASVVGKPPVVLKPAEKK